MGAGGDDFFNLVVVQDFDIFCGHHLVDHFITGTSGEISRTFFFCSQYGKADACFLENLNQGFGYFFGSVIKGTGTAHPEQVIHIRVFCHGFHFQTLCPVGSFVIADTPWIPVSFESFQGWIKLFRVFTCHQGLALSHGHNPGDMLDGNRADLFTGTASGTGPECVWFDDISHQRVFAVQFSHFCFYAFDLFFVLFSFESGCKSSPFDQIFRLFQHFEFQTVVEVFQIKRFIRDVCGADVFTSAAFCTGIQIQSLFPVHLVYVIDSKWFIFPDGLVFQIQQFCFLMGIIQAL